MMSGGHRILLMLVGVSLLTSGQAECPSGDWEESRGSCYLFVLDNRTQAAAETACVTQGGNLTSVADEEENNFISNISLSGCGDASCLSVWFGLSKMVDIMNIPEDEGWTWLDGSIYDKDIYNKWRAKEPTGGVFCARMYVKDGVAGEWGDLDCGVTFPYVCKRKATAPSTTTTTTTMTTSTSTTTTTTTTSASVPSSTTTRTGMSDEQDWVSWRGSLYLFLVEKKFSQHEAASMCMSYGGHLASVLSPEENEFIYNTTKYSCTDSCNDVWIGLRRHGPFPVQNNNALPLTQRRANWTWLNGHAYSSSWANWKSTEPTGDSACARMILNQDQNWGDIGCDQQYPCVCKKEAVETTAVAMPTTSRTIFDNNSISPTFKQSSTTADPTNGNAVLYIGAGVGVGVVVGIIVVIIVVVIVVKRRKKSKRREVTDSQSAPSDGDAGEEGGYSYVEVRPAKIMKEVMEGVYSEANNDAKSQDVDTASEASVTSPPPTVGRPSVTSPSQGDEYANVSTLKRPQNNSIQKSVTQTTPKPSDAPDKSGVYDNDPVSPTTHKVADSGDEYALVTRSDTGEMTMAPPGGQ